jgi:hypothetical protein
VFELLMIHEYICVVLYIVLLFYYLGMQLSKELKDIRHYWRDEMKNARDEQAKVIEYKNGLDELSLEEMIKTSLRADFLVGALRQKVTAAEQMKRDLDKELLLFTKIRTRHMPSSQNTPSSR